MKTHIAIIIALFVAAIVCILTGCLTAAAIVCIIGLGIAISRAAALCLDHLSAIDSPHSDTDVAAPHRPYYVVCFCDGHLTYASGTIFTSYANAARFRQKLEAETSSFTTFFVARLVSPCDIPDIYLDDKANPEIIKEEQ